MRLLEYQGKALFRAYGIPAGKGRFVETASEAVSAAASVGYPAVLKTQVYSGGRGKRGGIAVVEDAGSAGEEAKRIVALDIDGEASKGLLVEEALKIEKEFYLGITIDPSSGVPVLIFSVQGGMDIEQIAASFPERVGRLLLPVLDPPRRHVLLRFFRECGAPRDLLGRITEIALALTKLFFDEDATTAEINPLALLSSGELAAADSKVVIDDSALYRHPGTPRETVILSGLEERAQKVNVSFIPLDGEIAVIAGGAGLAMATMDLVSHFGSSPSSFLDTGGGISSETMAESLRVSLARPNVRGVIINVFGGINDCAVMARGISEVVDHDRPEVPVVVKMRGHSQDEGWAMLEARGVPVVKFGTSEDAVRMLIDLIRSAR
jgi:succinyl-CoA synthetase beta subunit